MADQTSDAVAKGDKALAALGRFADDGQPMKEAEYRSRFVMATLGSSDEEIAQPWKMNHDGINQGNTGTTTSCRQPRVKPQPRSGLR